MIGKLDRCDLLGWGNAGLVEEKLDRCDLIGGKWLAGVSTRG